MATGFQPTIQGLTIEKDYGAQLIYTFDWSQWLPTGDNIAQVDYTIAARANDPDPLVKVSQGIQDKKTYVEIKEGQVNKSYVVTCKITTADGLVEQRFFRVKVLARSA